MAAYIHSAQTLPAQVELQTVPAEEAAVMLDQLTADSDQRAGWAEQARVLISPVAWKNDDGTELSFDIELQTQVAGKARARFEHPVQYVLT